jgi:predicted TIM-barrel fold metal-dependent hydrolase
MLYDLDERFRVMDRFDGYEQILSLPTPPLEVMGTPVQALELARVANDGMAELVARHPQRFAGFVASLPFNDPDAAVQEARRAVDTLGARGIQIFSNVNGKPISAPEFLPALRPWPATICRYGCIPTAPPPPTTPPEDTRT